MSAWRSAIFSLVGFSLLAACDDASGPQPVGLMWGSGASGAFVGDTISLVVFYRDAAGDPLGLPRPSVTWASSRPGVVSIVSESLAVGLDTGRAVLTATSASGPAYTVPVPFEIIPPWQGRLVWARQLALGQQVGLAVRDLPSHEIRQVPEFGYPGQSKGDPYLNGDGSKVAAVAPRVSSPVADRTIFIVDLVGSGSQAPFDTMPGHHISPVWMPGDSLIAFLTNRTGPWEVFTARPDGSGLTQRTQQRQSLAPFFDVTPDNHLVLPLRLAEGGVDLFELTLAGDTVRRLTTTPTQEEVFPSVSPDGAMIAFSSLSNVWIAGRDGSNPRPLLPPRRVVLGPTQTVPAGSGSPSWSRDSEFVLLLWTIDPTFRLDQRDYYVLSELYAIRVADGLAIRLTRSPTTDAQPVFR